MAIAMSSMILPSASTLESKSFVNDKFYRSGNSTMTKSSTGLLKVRAASKEDQRGFGGLSGLLDSTKVKPPTREDVLRNQEQEEYESEKRSVFRAVPSNGSVLPRPEIDRRPETGDRSFGSLMAFDGAGPETINGRLAMVGIVWAFAVEKMTGQTVAEMLYAPGSFGLFNFFAVTQLFTYASLVPMFKGESPDSRRIGPFNAVAERWNGRAAMIGFLSLVIIEAFTKSRVFQMM